MEILLTSLIGSLAAIAMAVSNYFVNRLKIQSLQEQFIGLKDYLAQFEGGILTVKCPNCGHIITVDAESLVMKMDELMAEAPSAFHKIKSIRGDKNDSNK